MIFQTNCLKKYDYDTDGAISASLMIKSDHDIKHEKATKMRRWAIVYTTQKTGRVIYQYNPQYYGFRLSKEFSVVLNRAKLDPKIDDWIGAATDESTLFNNNGAFSFFYSPKHQMINHFEDCIYLKNYKIQALLDHTALGKSTQKKVTYKNGFKIIPFACSFRNEYFQYIFIYFSESHIPRILRYNEDKLSYEEITLYK